MSHVGIWMSHVTHINESWHIQDNRTLIESCPHINESCEHTDESRHTYPRVMAHISTSHGTHFNESWHTQNDRMLITHQTLDLKEIHMMGMIQQIRSIIPLIRIRLMSHISVWILKYPQEMWSHISKIMCTSADITIAILICKTNVFSHMKNHVHIRGYYVWIFMRKLL